MPLLMLKDLPRYECLLEAARTFPDLDPSACEAYLNLLRAGDEAYRQSENFLSEHNMSPGRFTVLMLLYDKLSGTPRAQTPAELADKAGGLCCRRRVHEPHAMEPVLQEPSALGKGDGYRDDSMDVADVGTCRCKKIEMDVENMLELDEQLDIEDQVVEARADRTLDRVLDRDEGGIDLATVRCIEAIRDRRHRNRLGVRQGGDRQERLLREGALGA